MLLLNDVPIVVVDILLLMGIMFLILSKFLVWAWCSNFLCLLQFVEVIGPDGKKKRFANGTRAGFAVERFNKLIPNDSKPVVCIQAYKEGEEPIEFGPDVELILYDTAWVLQSVSEYVFPIPDNYVEAEIETIQTQTVEKELYKWSDSSQAPWEINEDVAKTLLDKTAPTDGEILPGARVSTLMYMIGG
ncbi:hypothetical protein KC19_11G039100 [Ceratodon purpureus]|uniref:Uncharacterized protein n=1 Tax=Ceratodon purpureus TaxID=3225 RepID=A0A8T0GDS9_CERPU|nr:hypothetical protein KC19_11G039100 [Ceratodon purpureus]